MVDQEVWVTTWNRDNSGYVTEGPCKVVGVEINCDSLRGIDCLIVSGAKHAHFNPEDVWLTEEEAQKNTEKENARVERRKEIRDRMGNQSRVIDKTSHEQGECPWVTVSSPE